MEETLMKRPAFFPTSVRWFLTPLLLILTVLTISGADPAQADTVTFAQFTQRTVSNQDFTYSNNGTSATLSSMSGGIPILLSVTNGFAPGLEGVEAAHLFLTSSTTAAAVPPAPGDDLMRQHFAGGANLLQIILDTPVNGKNDFLTVSFSDAVLSGRSSSSEASLKGSDTSGRNPAQVSFSSDFLSFSNASALGFSLAFSSVDSRDGSGALQLAEDGFFKDFTASGTGTFDISSASAVAEPATLLLAGFGLFSAFLVGGIRRFFHICRAAG
jgi:hypothetical protein